MAETQSRPRLIRFGAFEADVQTGELRKHGVKLKFSGQPFQVLAILLERPGDVVTREELQKRLWPDTFVDVERNLNTAVNKIREVLGDSAETPRYVETLPRRGYRFIAPVDGGVPSFHQIVESLPPAPPKSLPRSLYYGLAALCVVLVAGGTLALWKTAFQAPDAPKVLRFTKLTNDGQVKDGPLATDGSRVYFNEILPDTRKVIRQVSVEGGETILLSVPLTNPRLLALSKTGNELLVASDGEKGHSFWVQPSAGGSPRRVGTIEGYDAGFGADETSVLVGKENEVDSVSSDGFSRTLLTMKDLPFHFRFSPDRRVVRFTQFEHLNDTMGLIEVRPDGTGAHKVFDGCCGEWTPDGRFFIFQDRRNGRLDLWAVAEGRSSWWRKRDVKPIQLTSGPLDFQFPLPNRDGRQIFAIGTTRRAEIVRYNPHSREFIPYLPGISAETLAFSTDGKWVAYTSYPDGNLWRSHVDGTQRLQLTFSPLRAFLPRWSPDGKQIAFNAKLPAKTWNIYLISSEGGTPQRILPSGESQMDACWSPDGNSLAFGSAVVPNKPIYTIDLRSRRVSILPGSIGLYSPHWSPDGKYLAAHPVSSDTLKLFDFAAQKWTQAWAEPPGSYLGYENWSHDGKYIVFQSWSTQDSGYRVFRLRLSDRKIEEVVNLKNIKRLNDPWYAEFWFGLGPDDSPLLSRDISTQEIYALEMDWP